MARLVNNAVNETLTTNPELFRYHSHTFSFQATGQMHHITRLIIISKSLLFLACFYLKKRKTRTANSYRKAGVLPTPFTSQ